MREPLPEEKWLVMEDGHGTSYVLPNTGDVDERQILARCKTEEIAERLSDAWDYYKEQMKYLKNIGVPE